MNTTATEMSLSTAKDQHVNPRLNRCLSISDEDVLRVKVAFHSSEDLKAWVKKITHDAECWTYPKWPADLWAKSYEKIIEFLCGRFRETTDKQEYYLCMPYLQHNIDPEELYVLWEDSPNYRLLKAGEKPTHTNPLPISTVLKDGGVCVNNRCVCIKMAGGRT